MDLKHAQFAAFVVFVVTALLTGILGFIRTPRLVIPGSRLVSD